jgi:uncharacterized damage-inducible protein DinB
MESTNQLAIRIKEVLIDGKWIANTNYKDTLSSITWEEATKTPNGLNSISSLAYHINYYLAGILNVFENNTLDIEDKYSFDCPLISSKKKWESLLNNFLSNAEKIVSYVDSITEQKLEEIFVNEKYGNYRRNLEGVIEHSYYHLGQISLIIKIIREEKD